MDTKKKTDRRVRRTKTLLTDALVSLLETKTINDISVKELCDTADINRGTFYLHYKDIYDMMNQLETDILVQFELLLSQHQPEELNRDPYILLLDLFRFSSENAPLFRSLLGSKGDISFLVRIKSLFRERYLDIWSSDYFHGDSTRFEYSYSFIAAGCIGLMENWLFSEQPQSPEEIAALASSIITTGMQSLI